MPDNDADPTPSLAGAPMLIRHTGGAWVQPATSHWTNEAALRDLIAANPSLIPGVESASAAVTEFVLGPTGRIDVLIVDPDGAITVVEAKLEANPEPARRHRTDP